MTYVIRASKRANCQRHAREPSPAPAVALLCFFFKVCFPCLVCDLQLSSSLSCSCKGIDHGLGTLYIEHLCPTSAFPRLPAGVNTKISAHFSPVPPLANVATRNSQLPLPPSLSLRFPARTGLVAPGLFDCIRRHLLLDRITELCLLYKPTCDQLMLSSVFFSFHTALSLPTYLVCLSQSVIYPQGKPRRPHSNTCDTQPSISDILPKTS
ncbi:hypothetical protein LZ32DRAFT_603993 [Colletotrichum eremochloae]|nr:hypothetical protein LZ32DRAFT_603993 [Colletotrichum eremochloae]